MIERSAKSCLRDIFQPSLTWTNLSCPRALSHKLIAASNGRNSSQAPHYSPTPPTSLCLALSCKHRSLHSAGRNRRYLEFSFPSSFLINYNFLFSSNKTNFTPLKTPTNSATKARAKVNNKVNMHGTDCPKCGASGQSDKTCSSCGAVSSISLTLFPYTATCGKLTVSGSPALTKLQLDAFDRTRLRDMS
jgi:hypothetical protein